MMRNRLLRTGPGTLLAPLLVFVGVLVALVLVDGSPAGQGLAEADEDPGVLAARADTAALIGELREAVRTDPADPQAAVALGDAFYQRLRETGGGALADRADRAYRAALAIEPGNAMALTGRATIALNAHRFADGLELARKAHRAAPRLPATYPALVDGLIETGRYPQAGRALERLLALKPSQAAYLRASYFRELHGDVAAAARALGLAISAGAGTVEGAAYVRTLLGDFEASRGNYGAAERAYREALAGSPGYRGAEAGLALLRAGRGELGAAISTLRKQLGDPPSPDVLIELGELEQAAGREPAARRHYAEALEIEADLLRSGSGYDAGVTLNEAKHGDPARAVTYGRRAWRSAPSVSSADAYSWALFRAGRIGAASRFSAQAMRLGSRDPEFRFHAGMIAAAAGETGRARRLLAGLLERTPRFSPLYAPRARAVLRELR